MRIVKQAFAPVPKNSIRIIINNNGKQYSLQTTGNQEFRIYDELTTAMVRARKTRKTAFTMEYPQTIPEGASV